VSSVGARQAYLDGELCGVFPDGVTSFGMIQAASDAGNTAGLVYFIFDLLHHDGDDIGARPLIERKTRLAALLSNVARPLYYSDYHRGQGPAFHEQACKLGLEGIVSKRADAAYAPGNRGLWLKVKCLHREEFVVVGWTDPEGRRPYLGERAREVFANDIGKRVFSALVTESGRPKQRPINIVTPWDIVSGALR
jgi:ATP-dependent DNA ligase